MQQIKQVNEFTNLSKTRDKTSKEMAPVIQKYLLYKQNLSRVRHRPFRSQADQGQGQRSLEVRKRKTDAIEAHKGGEAGSALDQHSHRNHPENDLTHSKLTMGMTTVKDELHSLERTIDRRQEYFQAYDKKLNNIMETLSKHNSLVNDRMYVFQEKFKQLTKETLEMTKDIKRDFDATMITNQVLKNELVHKIRNTEEKEKILDLYMSEREEIPKKITEIYEDLKNCLRHSEFHEFKIWHQAAIEESLSKAKKMVDKVLASQTNQELKGFQARFKEIDELRRKSEDIEEVKQRIEAISFKIDSMEKTEDHKIAQIREQAEEIQQKIIEVIDKKIDNIEEQMENYNTQKEESIDEKFRKMKGELLELMQHHSTTRQPEYFFQPNPTKTVINNEGEQVLISRQLEYAKREREIIQQHSKEVRDIADGLQSKLSLFNNKITMCRSDIDIFMQATTRQLRKIMDIRKDEESHMESVGKVLANIMQAVLVLTSLSLCQSKGEEAKSFVSYQDGILLQLQKEQSSCIKYRKYQIGSYDLKESLVLTLLKEVDDLIMGQNILRWDKYKPSSFFNKIKDSLMNKSKRLERSPSVHLQSPRRRNKKQGDEQLMFDFNMQSEELLKNGSNKLSIPINNSNLLWTCEKPKSEMQKRYKIKRHQQKTKKESEERNCFTASRSHRKTKIAYN